MRQAYLPRVNLQDAPTLGMLFHDWDNYALVAIGPVGSGKTYGGLCTKVFAHALRQPVHPATGTIHCRYAIVRNTSPELKLTTLKTWLELFPEHICGPVRYSAPIMHHLRIRPTWETDADGHKRLVSPGLDCEVYFVPLDKPRDVAKLRSMELTGAAINEVSEVPLSIVTMLRRRVGRYPKRDRTIEMEGGGFYECWHPIVVMDSNATDTDHWLSTYAKAPPEGWAFYLQPPAVLEMQKADDGTWHSVEPGYSHVCGDESIVFAAGRHWAVNPGAENLQNLRRGYYDRQQLPGSTLQQIQRDVQAKWVYVLDGRPVITGFNRQVHVRAFDLPENIELMSGGDIGGGTLNPAAILGYRNRRGIWMIVDEVVASDMGLRSFVAEFKAVLSRQHFREARATHTVMHGDPAGEKRDELFEVIIFKHLRAAGLNALPVMTNVFGPRVEAIEAPLGRMVDGAPGLVIHPRCTTLIKALEGAWHFRRIQMAGEERFSDQPSKNHPYSDCGDALGYLLLGGGEYQAMVQADQDRPEWDQVHVASADFDVW